eukprot:gnl/Chilomastix_caulleri/4879.p1 GENE.gnl/Chilomastix_caulleri/4879~~gnl/Chilomastix_caulleri/4879.p1  ORF type:complete len:85 (+),score=6.96 gnl/Chilomastix_caulleri/4879:13-267(+)
MEAVAPCVVAFLFILTCLVRGRFSFKGSVLGFDKIPKQLDRLRKCTQNTWVLNIPPPYNIYGKSMLLYKLRNDRVIVFNPFPPN